MVQTEMEYTGPVTDFQGKLFQVRSPSRVERAKLPDIQTIAWVMVQNAELFGDAQWVPGRIQDFTPITGKPVF